MGNKGNPRTRPGFNATLQKQPRAERIPADYSQKPSWRFSLLEMCDPYGWHEIGREKLLEVHVKLKEFEKLTWHEILVENSDRNHPISKFKICKPAFDRLAEIKQDDIDELVSLRLSGPERIWGILELGTLRLLWWDPDHQICPSHKRNT